MSKHIQGSTPLSTKESAELDGFVNTQHTAAQKLERVSMHDPKYETREVVHLDAPTSFTRGTYAEGPMGAIGVKYSDEALIVIDNPRTGHDVDYSKLGYMHFSAAGEAETIVGSAPRYRVVSVQEIDHPGKAVYGGFMVYHLEEL